MRCKWGRLQEIITSIWVHRCDNFKRSHHPSPFSRIDAF